VEVDRPSLLEFGDLGVRHPHQLAQLTLLEPDQAGQGTLDGDGGPPPQLRGKGVPQHLRPSVIAARTQRLPQPRIVLAVAVPAPIPHTMWAAGALPVRVTGQHQPPLRPARVDSAEARGSEGHEQPRMRGHGLGDALATLEPSGQELVGVGPVGGRTGWAARLPPGATRLEQHPVRLSPAVVDGADLPGAPVGVLDPAGQADGVVAVAGLGDELGPAVIAVPGPVDNLGEDAGEQLAHVNRVGHAAPSGAGIDGTTRSPGACSASNAAGSAYWTEVARMMAATWW
jgi:hypothetical protein